MILLDGKTCALRLKDDIRRQVADRTARGLRAPHLGIILVGDDPASTTYVGHKQKEATQVGFRCTFLHLPSSTTQADLLRLMEEWNRDPEMDGYIVQLPLPPHICEQTILTALAPQKDVDGFSPVNMGNLLMGYPGLPPAMPMGILTLLREYNIPLRGKHCVILSGNHLLDRPLANLLSEHGVDATVTICHEHTADLRFHTLSADIVILAVDHPCSLTGDMIRPGTIVIDAGNNYIPADTPSGYRSVGDADFASVAPRCEYISPVPGGVGPMIILSLLQNTLNATR